MVEEGGRESSALLKQCRPPWKAFVVGVTGPPGTGKSSLVDKLIAAYRRKGLRIGVVAVDPSSPITGGALLGDRIRMKDHAGDKGVFIRSMASRGWSGGLSRAASQAVQLLDSAGFDVIFVETVGIGQSDIEVVGISHSVMIVLMPGMGDDVQMSKAGLMEVGDIYVVNKSDLEGADLMVMSLLGVVRSSKGRPFQVIKVSSMTGDGLEKLESSLEAMRKSFVEGGEDLRLKSARGMVIETARGDLNQKLLRVSETEADRLAGLVLKGKLSVGEAASELVR